MRICQKCDGPIPDTKRADAKFCSDRCKKRVENKRLYKPSTRTRAASKCKQCKSPIAAVKQATAVYCTRTCKLKANRKHHSTRRDVLKRGNGDYLPFSEADWQRLKNRYNNCCAYCDKQPKRLEKDHVVPLSRGGRHALANIVPACRRCNQQKKDKLLIEWKRELHSL